MGMKLLVTSSSRPCITIKSFTYSPPVTNSCTKLRLSSTQVANPKETVFPERAQLPVAQRSALERLSTSSILRSLVLSTFLTSPTLFKYGFACMRKIADSSSPLLNPDKNFMLRMLIKPLVYDQFCAGTTQYEISKTQAQIKALGFSGVALCYGKESKATNTHIGQDQSSSALEKRMAEEINEWKQGNLDTLSMIGEGDYLAMKLTGGGEEITNALMECKEIPKPFETAMDEIARMAANQHSRIWIDAEQQVLQPAIDKWTLEFMRRYNKIDRTPLIYNTIQAYLKESRPKLESQLRLAELEGWSLGIKLVRGAYIQNDIRNRIHDTKEATDDSYNGIVRDLITGEFPGYSSAHKNFRVLLAGHNPQSANKAMDLVLQQACQGKGKVSPEFAQLQGMADDLGCGLLQRSEAMREDPQILSTNFEMPRVYKCLTWGSIQECMQYLVRRAVENHGATARMKDGMSDMFKELRRRMGVQLRWWNN